MFFLGADRMRTMTIEQPHAAKYDDGSSMLHPLKQRKREGTFLFFLAKNRNVPIVFAIGLWLLGGVAPVAWATDDTWNDESAHEQQ